MESLHTFVYSYQDAAGHVWNARHITDNPDARDVLFSRGHLEQALKDGGMMLLALDKVETMPCAVDVVESKRGTLWGRTYHVMLAATFVAALGSIAYSAWADHLMLERIGTFTTQASEARARLFDRMGKLEENVRAIGPRIDRLETTQAHFHPPHP